MNKTIYLRGSMRSVINMTTRKDGIKVEQLQLLITTKNSSIFFKTIINEIKMATDNLQAGGQTCKTLQVERLNFKKKRLYKSHGRDVSAVSVHLNLKFAAHVQRISYIISALFKRISCKVSAHFNTFHRIIMHGF